MKSKLAQLGFERDLQRLDGVLSALESNPVMLPLLLDTQREKTRLLVAYIAALSRSSEVTETTEMRDKINAMLQVLLPFVPQTERENVGEQLSRIDKGNYSTAITKR
jgi:hypothetical protein